MQRAIATAVAHRFEGGAPPLTVAALLPAAPAPSFHRGVDVFERAISAAGQLAVKRAWAAAVRETTPAHRGRASAATAAALGGGALGRTAARAAGGSGARGGDGDDDDDGRCPAQGIEDGGLVALLARLLPAAPAWQLWDAAGALAARGRGRASWRDAHLAVALVAAAAAGRQAAALGALEATIRETCCCGGSGGGGSSRGDSNGDGCDAHSSDGDDDRGSGGGMQGLRACALLLGVPLGRLCAEAERLGLADGGGGGGGLAPVDVTRLLSAAVQQQGGADSGGSQAAAAASGTLQQQQLLQQHADSAAAAQAACWPCCRPRLKR